MKLSLRSKNIFLVIFVIVMILIARPVIFLTYNFLKDTKVKTSLPPRMVQDASGLNQTRVDTVIHVDQESDKALLQVSMLIGNAKSSGRKVSIAGASHSMGGHTIYPDGIVLDMRSFNKMELDTATNVLKVGAGALWNQVIPYLDKYGRSVAVMQSNNSFSVGGSISVNCHGWQPNSAPIASTVLGFRLMNEAGNVLHCSRTENPEIFGLVLGGYGLFGVILDVELKTVENKLYSVEQHIIDSKDYIKEFDRIVNGNPGIGLVYGRLNINPKHFLEEAILSTYVVENKAAEHLSEEASFSAFRRTLFRSSVGSDYGKNLRWTIEKAASRILKGKSFSRNRLLNEGVEVFENTDTTSTDILHEYFIPKNKVPDFIKLLKQNLVQYDVDLLNITLRNVMKDDDSFLNYARSEVFGFVMLFNQKKTPTAEAEMKKLTSKLIELSSSLNGTYYLPYRLHAEKLQLRNAYPQIDTFFQLKRKYDPDEVFSNQFYKLYSR